MTAKRQVIAGAEDEGLWMDDDTIHAELYYPRAANARKRVTVGMTDTRLCDDITITYDFGRNGWSVTREVVRVHDGRQRIERTGVVVEVAFVAAFTEDQGVS